VCVCVCVCVCVREREREKERERARESERNCVCVCVFEFDDALTHETFLKVSLTRNLLRGHLCGMTWHDKRGHADGSR